MFTNDNERGQVGIGTLIVFIAMVLVAAIAAGVLINTAGFLQSKSSQTGQQSVQQVSNRLDVVSTYGPVDSSAKTVTSVNLTVKKSPGSDSVDLSNVTIQWIGPNGAQALTYASSDGAGADFLVSSVKDSDGSMPVLNNPDDRFEIQIPLNQTGAGNLAPLGEGDTATLKLTTMSGATVEVQVQVPQSVSGQTAVEL